MDHIPLCLLIPLKLKRYKKHFQFFNYMINLSRFFDEVQEAWNSPLYGDPMTVFYRKLQLVKKRLVALNKAHGNVSSCVSSKRAKLHSTQSFLVGNPFDEDLILKEHVIVTALNQALDNEESILNQKAMVNWLHLGDGNTRFFFGQTKSN